ncbi:putative nuclease HARBI1 [Haliotis rufescens]|uniref:putative nuclease HARBI1 n=2 Tax=Haliotis rufescens TaxID=6454 RepID=UPI00201EE325|nr:putative nuclease HARBI1 [Haliotis rufescens]
MKSVRSQVRFGPCSTLSSTTTMAAHLRQTRQARRNTRVPRVFRDRSNPLEDLDVEEVFDRYRFRPNTIIYLLGLLDLTRETARNCAIPPLLQLLVCLRFLATGAMHLLVGDSLNISRSTAGRCIRAVSLQISKLSGRFIKFPVGGDAVRAKEAFGNIAGFPNVVGCIDGTFIRIQRPTTNEGDFVNRKGYHSLNVQMCCDANFCITSCNASWPGSVHDSRIFRTSALCRQFENGQYKGFLLGDSGYPCRWFLLTPLLNPTNRAEERYNGSLCRTRVLIEQTFGVLKRRFQCLHNELRATPRQAVTYVVACVVLHNLGIERGDIINHDENLMPPSSNVNNYVPPVTGPNDGADVRRHIIQTFFSR